MGQVRNMYKRTHGQGQCGGDYLWEWGMYGEQGKAIEGRMETAVSE